MLKGSLKDLERIKEKASQELPASNLAELELDIEAVKGFANHCLQCS